MRQVNKNYQQIRIKPKQKHATGSYKNATSVTCNDNTTCDKGICIYIYIQEQYKEQLTIRFLIAIS